MSIKPITAFHQRAVHERDASARGLRLRAEYCDFMSAVRATDGDSNTAALWAHSAERRRKEAARAKEVQSV